jgi:ankyrin repeat protein
MKSFQWVKYQLDNLFLLRTDDEIWKFMETIESPLDDVYARTLRSFSSLSDDNNKLIRSVLRVLVGFLRPPQFEELVVAARMENGGSIPSDLKEKLGHDTIRKLFKGLVEINPETHAYQFSHYSVREFLVSSRLEAAALKEYQVGEDEAHRELASRCVEYLNDDSNSNKRFYDYAATFWMDHVKRTSADSKLDDAIVTFLSSGQLTDYADAYPIATWLGYLNKKSQFPSRAGYDGSKIFTEAIKLGRDSVTHRLIDLGIHHIQSPHGYDVPLVDAVMRGASDETIQKLLRSGVDVKEVRFGSQTALSAAIMRGNCELVTLMIDFGADIHQIVDPKEKVEGSPLNQAVMYSSPDMMAFLLGMGVNVNKQVSHVGTALQVAVSEQRIDIAKLLLSHNADVCTLEGDYGTVLHVATQRGINNEDIIRLLLSNGANEIINELNRAGRSALCEAVSFQSGGRVIELLLQSGADPNLEGAPSTNPLHLAILRQDENIVDILLKNGSNGISSRGPFRTALECAAFAGHGMLFRRFVRTNPSDLQSKHNSSRILQRAMLGGHLSILAYMLQICENLHEEDEHGWTAHTCALHIRNDKVLTMLKRGDDEQEKNITNPNANALCPSSWDFNGPFGNHSSHVQLEKGRVTYMGKCMHRIFHIEDRLLKPHQVQRVGRTTTHLSMVFSCSEIIHCLLAVDIIWRSL